jgi:hypothetical protein
MAGFSHEAGRRFSMLALLVPDTGTFELMHITFISLTSASLLYRLVNTNPGKTMQPMLLVAPRTSRLDRPRRISYRIR